MGFCHGSPCSYQSLSFERAYFAVMRRVAYQYREDNPRYSFVSRALEPFSNTHFRSVLIAIREPLIALWGDLNARQEGPMYFEWGFAHE